MLLVVERNQGQDLLHTTLGRLARIGAPVAGIVFDGPFPRSSAIRPHRRGPRIGTASRTSCRTAGRPTAPAVTAIAGTLHAFTDPESSGHGREGREGRDAQRTQRHGQSWWGFGPLSLENGHGAILAIFRKQCIFYARSGTGGSNARDRREKNQSKTASMGPGRASSAGMGFCAPTKYRTRPLSSNSGRIRSRFQNFVPSLR